MPAAVVASVVSTPVPLLLIGLVRLLARDLRSLTGHGMAVPGVGIGVERDGPEHDGADGPRDQFGIARLGRCDGCRRHGDGERERQGEHKPGRRTGNAGKEGLGENGHGRVLCVGWAMDARLLMRGWCGILSR